MNTHGWQSIEPIPEGSGPGPEYLASLDSLQRLWLQASREAGPDATARLVARLHRSSFQGPPHRRWTGKNNRRISG